MTWFCKHDDMLIDKTVIPSPASELGLTSIKGELPLPRWMFQRKVVWHWKCQKCKRVHHLVVSN